MKLSILLTVACTSTFVAATNRYKNNDFDMDFDIEDRGENMRFMDPDDHQKRLHPHFKDFNVRNDLGFSDHDKFHKFYQPKGPFTVREQPGYLGIGGQIVRDKLFDNRNNYIHGGQTDMGSGGLQEKFKFPIRRPRVIEPLDDEIDKKMNRKPFDYPGDDRCVRGLTNKETKEYLERAIIINQKVLAVFNTISRLKPIVQSFMTDTYAIKHRINKYPKVNQEIIWG